MANDPTGNRMDVTFDRAVELGFVRPGQRMAVLLVDGHKFTGRLAGWTEIEVLFTDVSGTTSPTVAPRWDSIQHMMVLTEDA